jgi:WD40 repeat protein
VTRIVEETDRFAGVTSLEGGVIVVGLSGRSGEPDHLATVDPAADRIAVLSLPDRPECRRTDYQRPHRLPDGRLGAVRGCVPVGAGSDQLVAISMDPLSVEVLADPRSAVANVAWDPDLQRAIVDTGSDLCSGLATISRAGKREPIAITVRGDGETFDMRDALASAASSEACESTGWARWPALSPEGTIAFFASAEAAGEEGPARADASAGLYIAEPDDQDVEPLLTNVVRPRSLQWSPDGQWLAFGAWIDGLEGVWLFHPANETLFKVDDGPFSWLAWNEDGEGLLAVGPADGADSGPHELVEVIWPSDALQDR